MLRMIFLSLLAVFFSASAPAALQATRWTGQDDVMADFDKVLQKANAVLGTQIKAADLLSSEDQQLGTWRFQSWHQTVSGLPVKGASLRIWTDRATGLLVQAEARFEDGASAKTSLLRRKFTPLFTNLLRRKRPLNIMSLITRFKIRGFKKYTTEDHWEPEFGPVRTIKIFANAYYLELREDLSSQKIISKERKDYPREDLASDEFEMPAKVFVTPEEIESTRKQTGLPRQDVILRYLKKTGRFPQAEAFAEFQDKKFFDSMMDETKGMTEEGRAQGYWSQAYLHQEIDRLVTSVPLTSNHYTSGKSLLVGRYVTVTNHPNARPAFHPNFAPMLAPDVSFAWQLVVNNGKPDAFFNILGNEYGKPATDFLDFYNRPAPWREEALTTDLMNEGFDDVQVYWAVNQWFESFHKFGFNDEKISTRPITAILYDPDIENRDNAFYSDDTINFATYSRVSQNEARDSGTIWHELGHGLEDRILSTANYDGGLSEGMADAAAEIILKDVTAAQGYPGEDLSRINNQIAFGLTNEVHDNGEAYGGTAHDLLALILKKEGITGLAKYTDLILDAMRLSRANPDLTTTEWVKHVFFADQLGKSGVRRPFEYRELIQAVLTERNFSESPTDLMTFPILIDALGELTSTSPGSRENAIALNLHPNEQKVFHLKVKALSGAKSKFKYPVTLKVTYTGGPLQGAAHFADEIDQTYTITGPDEVEVPIVVTGVCDEINTNDQSCKDFAYLQIFNAGDDKPIGKKRFYVNVKPI